MLGCKLPPKKSREKKVLAQSEVICFLNRAKEEGYKSEKCLWKARSV